MRELAKARPYAESLIKNAPDSVFVSDLEGKILQANDAVSALLGFRPDELIEQSLSRFISPEETREFTAALREVVERGVTRNARLNPRSASGEVIPTALNASALRDPNGKVIGAIGILRDMREYEQVVRDLEKSKNELRELRNVIRRAVVLASDVIEPEHMSLFASDASPAIALRGQPAPVGPSLKEIAEAAAADADDPSGAPGHRGKQEHSGPTPPNRLQDPVPQDEAVRHTCCAVQKVPNVSPVGSCGYPLCLIQCPHVPASLLASP